MYAGLKANNLVNFYNSNLLDQMLQKKLGKIMNKLYGSNIPYPNLGKSTQSALVNFSSKPATMLGHQNSLFRNSFIVGLSPISRCFSRLQALKTVVVGSKLEKSSHSRERLYFGARNKWGHNDLCKNKSGEVNQQRPSNAIRHQQH